MEIEVR